jgi:hypothetical protein
MTPLQEHNAKLDELLGRQDLRALWKYSGHYSDVIPEEFEIGMYKSIYERTSLNPMLRHAARIWLESQGYHRLWGMPWPRKGELP